MRQRTVKPDNFIIKKIKRTVNNYNINIYRIIYRTRRAYYYITNRFRWVNYIIPE